MREILFRGKRIDNGELVEGNLIRYINGGAAILELAGLRIHFVNPDTVCQFTGLKDRNGQKIFEGDILLPPGEEDAHIRLVVEFKDYAWKLRWLGRESSFNHYLSNWDGEIYKVIGNIYDNPELLKKEA